jgi:hypothetical protein
MSQSSSEKRQKKVEWDERMNGEPNYFYDLPSDIQEKIIDKSYRLNFNECMKELPNAEITTKIKKKIALDIWSYWNYLCFTYGFWDVYTRSQHEPEYDYGRDRLAWLFDLRARSWGIECDKCGGNPRRRKCKKCTVVTNDDLKNHLIANGFKGVSKLKKYELIRKCISF